MGNGGPPLTAALGDSATLPDALASERKAKPRSARVGPSARVLAAVVAAFCLSVLLLAARLTPSAAGHGTHVELGLPPCGWAVTWKHPCPTCGMTTAFAHGVRGQFIAAFKAQPFGLLLCLGTAVVFWGAVHVAATGSRLGDLGARMLRPRVLWAAAAMAALSWAYKWATWDA